MIDPTKITNFDLSSKQLEEVLLFWICAAGKNAITSAKALDRFLQGNSPFKHILKNKKDLALKLKKCGIGCYNLKAKSFLSLAESGLDLRTCSVDDLEKIPGIGRKTARCFLIHSRRNLKHAGLDTHILKFLHDSGYPNVPKSTPTSQKQYLKWESIFLKLVPKGYSVAEFDLEIWNKYRNKR